jgi:hypothetical protein
MKNEDKWYDFDGNETTLFRLVRDEPDWAVNRISHHKRVMEGMTDEIERLHEKLESLENDKA